MACVASRSEITGSAVVAEISEATKITISSAGSARKPTIISRRAPSVPNAVPTSIAASERNTRAVANSPTSAIASAAGVSGSVLIDGMIAAATTIVPNTTYGAARNSGEASCASTASLWNSLWIARYGSQQARRGAVLQPGAALRDPADEQRRDGERRRDLEQLGQDGGPVHSTSASSATSVRKLYSR